jgi:hypothetical protein
VVPPPTAGMPVGFCDDIMTIPEWRALRTEGPAGPSATTGERRRRASLP